MYRHARVALISIVVTIVAGAALVACTSEPDNESIAQEQIRRSTQKCPQGCESPPPGCVVKGNVSEAGNKIYHVPE
jgi:hypothetical protein